MASTARWNKKRRLTYAIDNTPPHSDARLGTLAGVDHVLREAMRKWSAVSDFAFEPVGHAGDPDLTFRFDKIEDPKHAAVCEGSAGISKHQTITFDTDRDWYASGLVGTDGPNHPLLGPVRGVVFAIEFEWDVRRGGGNLDLCTLATHEIGHALGLGHSDDEGSVMQAELDSRAMAGTRYLAGDEVPPVDAVELARTYGSEIRPGRTVRPAEHGYLVIGGEQAVSATDSKSREHEIVQWGARLSPSAQDDRRQDVAEGYCWDSVAEARGYSRIRFVLRKASEARSETVPALLGGYTEYVAIDGKGKTHRVAEWGLGAEAPGLAAVYLGEMYSWNPYLDTDGVARFYGIVGRPLAEVGAMPVLGGYQEVGDARYQAGTLTRRRPWGDPDSEGRGQTVAVAQGRTYSSEYPDASFFAYLVLAAPVVPSED